MVFQNCFLSPDRPSSAVYRFGYHLPIYVVICRFLLLYNCPIGNILNAIRQLRCQLFIIRSYDALFSFFDTLLGYRAKLIIYLNAKKLTAELFSSKSCCPRTANGSSTTSPGRENNLMNHVGRLRGYAAECFLFPHSAGR